MKNPTVTLCPADDCGGIFADALNKLAAIDGAKKLVLSPGVYRFDKKSAIQKYLPVSNTISQSEQQTKHIGLLLENIDDLTIEGNGARLLMNGDMSAVVLKNCRNISLLDLVVDYLRPRISEMTVIKVDGMTAEFKIHADSPWLIEDGRFYWVNADGIMEKGLSGLVVQCAAPGNTSNLRSAFNPVNEAVSVEVTGENILRFTYESAVELKLGEVWQFRDPSRRENGIVIDNCENITLEGLSLGFTPGLGIVAQMSRDLTIRHHRHAPLPGSGRVCAAHADCIQISSCYGNVEIADGFFSGSQDDPINVHGTYLGVEKVDGNSVVVRFCQQETWGWLPFKVGDEVCFVRRKDILQTTVCVVKEAVMLDPFHVKLLLDKEFAPDDDVEYVLENLSANPDVYIHDCIFECYPTRGVLLTSSGKCRICNNEFRQTAARPAVFISADVNSWYESGAVRDVEISGNLFRFCQAASVEVFPKCPQPGSVAIHRNIRVFDNSFDDCAVPRLAYLSVDDLQSDIPTEFIKNLAE